MDVKLRAVQPVIHELEAVLQEVAEWRGVKISLLSLICSDHNCFCSVCKRDTSTLVLPEKLCGICWLKRIRPVEAGEVSNIDCGTF